MKLVFLVLSIVLFPGAFAQDHAQDHEASAMVKCDCPPDCHCKQPGGTCPKEGPCVEDCDCDKSVKKFGFYVNRGMGDAIERTENENAGMKTGAESDFIWINGKQFPTGFKPTRDFYKNAKFVSFTEAGADPTEELPRELRYRKIVSKEIAVLKAQKHGDCWAFGTTAVMEWLMNLIEGSIRRLSRAAVVACSGFGGCNGGNMAGDFFVKVGAVYEDEYGYDLACNRCDKSRLAGDRIHADGAMFLRGSDGRMPKLVDLKWALKKTGPVVICGSAGALGSGGRQDRPRSGSTNHCYMLAGYFEGKDYGWLDKTYWDIGNSWNEEGNPNRQWGDDGYGEYVLDTDGVHLAGSVITEAQVIDLGQIKPPEPILFKYTTGAGTMLDVTIGVKAKGWTQASLTAMLKDVADELEVGAK